MSPALRVPCRELEEFAVSCLVAAGAPVQHARTAAGHLVRTDAFGVHSHGLKNLGGYLDKARRGGLDLAATPTTVVDGPAYCLLDAHRGLGMVGGHTGVRVAVEKARTTGVALVVVGESTHFGAAGLYALAAAEAGMVGIVGSNVDPNMTVPGARGKVLGNNPLAYAVPAGRHPPVMLDIALSQVASLKVVAARDAGERVPEGWIVDGAGRPTTDPSRYPAEGAMVPMSAHKGYGLAVLVDVLTGVLASGPTSDQIPSWLFEPEAPNGVAHVFVVIDPVVLGGSPPFGQRVDDYLDRLHAAPLAGGAREILHPGQLEWRRHEDALAHGVELPDDVADALVSTGRCLGVRVPWG
ncbi:Ldh family oxidoreductase [Promicromonospora vindobonensis]|uniref:Ldh family oxidoreductase n=1 Tax=Promicromonospora vindobonensis TaxID=195748 RepID=A0ABW5VXB6_9MICO